MLIRGISIKARIGLTMAFLAALLLVVGLLGLIGMSQTNNAFRDTATVQMPNAAAIGNAEIFATRARLALDRATLVMGSSDANTIVDRSHMFMGQSEKWWNTYLAMPRNAQEDHLASAVKEKRVAYKAAMKEYEDAIVNTNRIAIAETAGKLQTTYSALSTAEGALSKVCVTELLQRIGRAGAGALGVDAVTAPGWFGDPLPQWFAYEVVERVHPTLSVGANEIQRTTIADVGLGLPPEPRA